jgi:hypothetical protein
MIDAMKQALEAFEDYQSRMSVEKFDGAITTLRQAIEQAEKQEPVAYKYIDKTNPLVFYFTDRKDVTPNPDVIETALYSAPPDVKHWKDLAEYRLQLLMKMPENKPVMRMLSKGEEPPTKREWVGLTDEEIKKVFEADWNRPNCPEWVVEFSKKIEAKLKEKNT